MTRLVGPLLVLLAVGLVGARFVALLQLPVVYTSWSTRECVRVEDATGEFSCNHLPAKYLSEWAK